MIELSGFLGRRRRWVVAAWVALVVCALPFASHQTDHLTGGGFDVPGSQSKAVSEAHQNDFGSGRTGSRSSLKAAAGRRPPPQGRWPSTGSAARWRRRRWRWCSPPPAARRGRRQLQRTGTALLAAEQRTESPTADRLGLDPARRSRPGHAEGGVTPYLVGQPTVWAGMQETLQEGPRPSRGERLPDRRPDPADRLRLAGRRGAAAGARLRQRSRHRRADLLHLAADGRPRSSSPTWPR